MTLSAWALARLRAAPCAAKAYELVVRGLSQGAAPRAVKPTLAKVASPRAATSQAARVLPRAAALSVRFRDAIRFLVVPMRAFVVEQVAER